MTDKILIDRAVVEQALEACSVTLERCTPRALQALRAALEQPPIIKESLTVEQEPKCVAIVEVFGTDWRLDYMSLPVGRHKLYTQQYNYTRVQPRQPLKVHAPPSPKQKESKHER